MPTSKLTVNAFDGSRKILGPDLELLVTIVDGHGKQLIRQHFPAGTTFELPFFEDGVGNNFRVIVFNKKFQQAGFMPVKCNPDVPQTLDLMLVKKRPGFNFKKWTDLPAGLLRELLAAGAASETAARDRYSKVMESRPAALACVLNITTAMQAINLPANNALSFCKELIWDQTMEPDRFYAWADPALLDQVKRAAQQGLFEREAGFSIFHPGATDSYKQIQFGEANVQITFHENEQKEISGMTCIKLEPDMDYFKDLAAHAILEVISNNLSGGLTDPKQVYVLRWMAGRQAGVPPFEPPYILE